MPITQDSPSVTRLIPITSIEREEDVEVSGEKVRAWLLCAEYLRTTVTFQAIGDLMGLSIGDEIEITLRLPE